MIELSDFEEMIKKLAWGCLRRLPTNYSSIEELEQEGRLVFAKLLTKRLRMDGAKFSTVLYRSLMNRFSDIVREAYQPMRTHYSLMTDCEVDEEIIGEQLSPQELLERKEVLDYIKMFDPNLADYLLHGPTEELIRFAKGRKVRASQLGRCLPDKTLINLRCLEEYFGFKLDDLLQSFNIGRPLTKSK